MEPFYNTRYEWDDLIKRLGMELVDVVTVAPYNIIFVVRGGNVMTRLTLKECLTRLRTVGSTYEVAFVEGAS